MQNECSDTSINPINRNQLQFSLNNKNINHDQSVTTNPSVIHQPMLNQPNNSSFFWWTCTTTSDFLCLALKRGPIVSVG
jgi:hypothetical protein